MSLLPMSFARIYPITNDLLNVIIAGVDECGRGPLAGPVVAAAVILPDNHQIFGLNDSKKISAKKRALLEPLIKKHSLAWAIAQVEADEIDEINILQASLLAMKKAINMLKLKPNKALVDGNFIPSGLDCEAEAIIKGDSLIESISAASIIAKEFRDRLLCEYDLIYPQYGFASHKGYPTKVHLSALDNHGITPIHRRSFSPVAKIATNNQG